MNLLTLIPCALALAIPSRAEEGGSAHYLPGAAASFIDAFPAKPGGFAVLNYFTDYKPGPPSTFTGKIVKMTVEQK